MGGTQKDVLGLVLPGSWILDWIEDDKNLSHMSDRGRHISGHCMSGCIQAGT